MPDTFEQESIVAAAPASLWRVSRRGEMGVGLAGHEVLCPLPATQHGAGCGVQRFVQESGAGRRREPGAVEQRALRPPSSVLSHHRRAQCGAVVGHAVGTPREGDLPTATTRSQTIWIIALHAFFVCLCNGGSLQACSL